MHLEAVGKEDEEVGGEVEVLVRAHEARQLHALVALDLRGERLQLHRRLYVLGREHRNVRMQRAEDRYRFRERLVLAYRREMTPQRIAQLQAQAVLDQDADD